MRMQKQRHDMQRGRDRAHYDSKSNYYSVMGYEGAKNSQPPEEFSRYTRETGESNYTDSYSRTSDEYSSRSYSDDSYYSEGVDWAGEMQNCMSTPFAQNMAAKMNMIRCEKTGPSGEVQLKMTLPLPVEFMDNLVPSPSEVEEAMDNMNCKSEKAYDKMYAYNMPKSYQPLFESQSQASTEEREEYTNHYDKVHDSREQPNYGGIFRDQDPGKAQYDQNNLMDTYSLPSHIIIKEQQSGISSAGSLGLPPFESEKQSTTKKDFNDAEPRLNDSRNRDSPRAIDLSSGRHGLERIANRNRNYHDARKSSQNPRSHQEKSTTRPNLFRSNETQPSFDEGVKSPGMSELRQNTTTKTIEREVDSSHQRNAWISAKREKLDLADEEYPSFDEKGVTNNNNAFQSDDYSDEFIALNKSLKERKVENKFRNKLSGDELMGKTKKFPETPKTFEWSIQQQDVRKPYPDDKADIKSVQERLEEIERKYAGKKKFHQSRGSQSLSATSKGTDLDEGNSKSCDSQPVGTVRTEMDFDRVTDGTSVLNAPTTKKAGDPMANIMSHHTLDTFASYCKKLEKGSGNSFLKQNSCEEESHAGKSVFNGQKSLSGHISKSATERSVSKDKDDAASYLIDEIDAHTERVEIRYLGGKMTTVTNAQGASEADRSLSTNPTSITIQTPVTIAHTTLTADTPLERAPSVGTFGTFDQSRNIGPSGKIGARKESKVDHAWRHGEDLAVDDNQEKSQLKLVDYYQAEVSKNTSVPVPWSQLEKARKKTEVTEFKTLVAQQAIHLLMTLFAVMFAWIQHLAKSKIERGRLIEVAETSYPPINESIRKQVIQARSPTLPEEATIADEDDVGTVVQQMALPTNLDGRQNKWEVSTQSSRM